jgi:hypothetical protein
MPPQTPAAQGPGNPADKTPTEGGSTETKVQPQQLFKISSDAEELKRRQEEAQVLSERLQDEDIDLDSERILKHAPHHHQNNLTHKIKEVEELSPEEDGESCYNDDEDGVGGLNSQNDSGMQKVLSRTKNSLQLHTFNKAGEESGEEEPDEDLNVGEVIGGRKHEQRDKSLKRQGVESPASAALGEEE